MRQIAGAFSQLEKARLVAKLKEARDQKRAKYGRCEGRKPIAVKYPEATARARELHKVSLRAISAKLASEGLLSSKKQQPFNHKSIGSMIKG